MKRWALVVYERVSEITEVDPKGRFHPDMKWVECDDKVKENWRYDESAGKFSPPPEVA